MTTAQTLLDDHGNTILADRQGVQYFQAPPFVARRMARLAEVQPGMRVLDPSAGHGALLDAVPRLPRVQLVAVEIAPDSAVVLRVKGYETHECDFMRFEADTPFDRVLMAPPWHNDGPRRHVRRAWRLLAPGGRLLVILPLDIRADKLGLALGADRTRHMQNPDSAFVYRGRPTYTQLALYDKRVE